MKTFKFIGVLFFILFLFVIPVSAITYENLVEDPVGLGYYSPNTMLEIESTRGWITVFNPSGAGSLDVKIYDLTNPEDATIGADGLIYFVLRDGRVFQCTDSSYTSFSTDYNTSFIYLGDIDTSTVDRTIVVDSSNNVYVNTGTKVYKFTSPSFAGAVLHDFGYTVTSLALHNDGLLVGGVDLSTDDYYVKVNLYDTSATQIFSKEVTVVSQTSAGGDTTVNGLYTTTNGDVYFSYYTKYYSNYDAQLHYADEFGWLDYSDSWSETVIDTFGATDVINTPSDMYISAEGVIYTPFVGDDTIKTYATDGLEGGYSGGITGEIEGSYINWDSSYVLGDTGSYTWGWDADDKSLLRSEKVKIYKDGVLLDTITVGDTGTRYHDLNIVGTYAVKLVTTFPFTSDREYASDYIDVTEAADSWINVPQNTPIKENFTAAYMYGATPVTPIINIKVLQNDYTYKIIDTKILPAAAAGTTYTTNLSISTVGNFVIDLYDNGKGLSEATDTIQTNYVYIPPSDVVLSSYINTTQNIYAFGGVISGSYAIEDNNFTDYHTKVEVYNVDKDIISFAYEPLHQIDSFDIPISDFDIYFYSDGDTRYPVNTNFLSGDNRVQLSAYNADGTLNEVIAHKNITISITDEEGYGLSLSKYTVEENEIFAIKAITPVQASIVIHPLTLMGVSDTTILINGTTQMSYALGIEDTYSISLVSGGETKATQIIKVLESEEITAPIEDEIEDEVTRGTIEMVIMFLSMPAFWGMIIWVGVVGGAAQSNAVNRSSTGYIAFALGNILAIVGMFAPYTMYVLVILWIGAGVFFKLGREAAGSEEY